MRAMWSGERRGLRFEGRYYELAGVHPGPAPAHPIEVWIGANMPRALALTGRVADGWVSPLMSYKPPREAAQANLAIDRAAREAGRDPRAIRRIYNVQGAFTSTSQGPAADTDQGIVGPPEHWVEVLTHLALDIGFGTFVLATPPDPQTLATFIEDVAPRVRERVAERRASSPVPAISPGQRRVSSAPAFEDTPETARGRMLYRMLLAVHAGIRGELARVERLAAAVVDGLSVDGINEELEALRNDSTLWQFQVSCLRYCRFVHSHHHAEDTDFFDELEETNPALAPVVERLRAEHRAVSDYLDAVEAAARALTDNDSVDSRRAVADALEELGGHLLAHLEYEERSVATTTRRLHDVPSPPSSRRSPTATSPPQEDQR